MFKQMSRRLALMKFYKDRWQDAISIGIADLSPREVNKKEKKKT